MAKSQKPSPIVKMAGLGILLFALYYAWVGTRSVDEHIASLPVEGSMPSPEQSESKTAKAVSLEKLNPVLVESTRKSGLLLAEASKRAEHSNLKDLDDVFSLQVKPEPKVVAKPAELLELPPEDQKPLPPPELPDYFKALPGQVLVQGLSEGGAFISGNFYSTGAVIDAIAYPTKDGKKVVSPILRSVKGNSAIVLEDPYTHRTVVVGLR